MKGRGREGKEQTKSRRESNPVGLWRLNWSICPGFIHEITSTTMDCLKKK